MYPDLRVGLVLSGGAARGIAHLGVFKALEENRIPVHAISGTSAGAIAGAFYAAGISIQKMIEFVDDSSLFNLFSLKLPNKGLTDLSYLRRKIKQYIPHNSFEKLNLPLTVALSNLNTGEINYFDSGELDEVIAASCAIPLLFRPIHIQGQTYVDGGLLANAPVQPLVGSCDFIITINLVPQVELEHHELSSIFHIAQRCFDLAALNNIKPQLRQSHVIIEPPQLKKISRFSLNRSREIFELGYEETQAKIDFIRSRMDVVMEMKGMEG